jgi:hypothetical protein
MDVAVLGYVILVAFVFSGRLFFISFSAWFLIYRSCSCWSRVDFAAPDLSFPCPLCRALVDFLSIRSIPFYISRSSVSFRGEPSGAGLVSRVQAALGSCFISFGLIQSPARICLFVISVVASLWFSQCRCCSAGFFIAAGFHLALAQDHVHRVF